MRAMELTDEQHDLLVSVVIRRIVDAEHALGTARTAAVPMSEPWVAQTEAMVVRLREVLDVLEADQ